MEPDLAAAFQDGATLAASDGSRLVVRRAAAGSLHTRGRVVAADPLGSPWSEALPWAIPPGEHPALVSFVRPAEGGQERPAALALELGPAAPARWERLWSFSLSAHAAAFMDEAAAEQLCDSNGARERLRKGLFGQGKKPPAAAVATLAAPRSKLTGTIAIRAEGASQGMLYAGLGPDGSPVVVVAGLGLLAGDRPLEQDRPAGARPAHLLQRLAWFVGGELFAEQAESRLAADRLVSPDVELVLDGAPPVRGRTELLRVLRGAGLGDLELGKLERGDDRARARFGWKATPATPAGDLAIEVAGGTIRRVTITRTHGPSTAVVPALAGSQEEALVAIREAGYRLGHVATRPDPAPGGTVLEQSPPPGTPWAPGSRVTLVVAREPVEDTLVPDVAGLDERDARAALSGARLFHFLGPPLPDTRAPAGRVATQEPAAGTTVPVGTLVQLRFPAEEARVFLPSLVGLPLDQALARLKLVRLKQGKVRQEPGDGPQGVVVATDPAGDAEVLKGARVDLVVRG